MHTKDSIRKVFETGDFLTQAYLADFTSTEMLSRPAASANHVAWQLGHLIASEHHLVESGVPNSMPPLPAGFAERHTKEAAASDAAANFLSKEEYFQVAKEVRAATLQVLDRLSDADLDQPVSGNLPPFVKTVGECLLLVGSHWIMHTGQWVVLRRKLGRPVMF